MEQLDRYFEKIKNEQPLLSDLDVRILLKNYKKKSNRLNWVNVAASIMLLISTTYIIFYTPNTDGSKASDTVAYNNYRYANLLKEISEGGMNENVKLIVGKGAKQNKIPIEKSAILKISKSRLEKIGFSVFDDKIVYKANVKKGGYLSFELKDEHTTMMVSDDPEKGIMSYDFYPLYLTNLEGKQITTRFRLKNESPDKEENFSKVINSLIPICVDIPHSKRQIVFWFLPTKDFLNILEEDIVKPKTKLRYDHIGLEEDFEIYPNPAKQFLSIEGELLHNGTEIHLLDINGGKVKKLADLNSEFDSSKAYKFDLEHVDKGVYLISIKKKNEPRLVKRLIITD